MQATSITSAPANENARAVHLVLLITDPEVAHALEQCDEGADRDAFARHALRIGVLGAARIAPLARKASTTEATCDSFWPIAT